MWLDLETIIQREVSQKEENRLTSMLTHACGIWKNGIDDLICKAEIETETQSTNKHGYQVGKGGQRDDLGCWD